MILHKLPVDADTALKIASGKGSEAKNQLATADELFEQGETKKAEKIYLKLLDKDTKDATLYNKLGLVYLADKNFKDAKSSLRQALKLEPNNDTFYNNLGLLYYEIGKYDDAIEAYEESVGINDKIASRLINLGLAYFMNKRYRKAADSYEKAVILDPRNESYVELLKKAEEKLK